VKLTSSVFQRLSYIWHICFSFENSVSDLAYFGISVEIQEDMACINHRYAQSC
jgi:hypothetical protein